MSTFAPCIFTEDGEFCTTHRVDLQWEWCPECAGSGVYTDSMTRQWECGACDGRGGWEFCPATEVTPDPGTEAAERARQRDIEDAARFEAEDAAYGAYVEQHGHDPKDWPDLAEQAADLLSSRARFDTEGQRLAELALLCSMPTEGVSWTPKPPKGPKPPPKGRLVFDGTARELRGLVAQMKGEVRS